jgi:hypothetical protein
MFRASLPKRTSTLDSQAIEAVVRFVRVLARCGCTPKDIAQEVLKAGCEVPKSWARTARTLIREMDAAAHIVTVWFSEPTYLDPKGNPKPLPLHGSGPSIESLAMRVDRGLRAKDVLRHLIDTRALRRVGTRYIPRNRLVSFRGSGGLYHSRSLRGLLAMLRTLEHNSAPERSTPGWFEVYSMNPRFPAKDRAAFDKRLRRLGMRFLVQIDADMHRRERRRKKGERTVPLGVAIYRFEEQRLQGRSRRRRPKRSGK